MFLCVNNEQNSIRKHQMCQNLFFKACSIEGFDFCEMWLSVKKSCSPSIMEWWLLEMNATRCIETSETTRPPTGRYIPEDSNPQPQRYQNLTSRTLHWDHEITALTSTCVKMTLNRWGIRNFGCSWCGPLQLCKIFLSPFPATIGTISSAGYL